MRRGVARCGVVAEWRGDARRGVVRRSVASRGVLRVSTVLAEGFAPLQGKQVVGRLAVASNVMRKSETP
eukprot:363195-Chlamydomonas_euryale.AAC.8